jgi:hypothetical protein
LEIGFDIFGERARKEQIWINALKSFVDVWISLARANLVQQVGVRLVKVHPVSIVCLHIHKVKGLLSSLAFGPGPGNFSIGNVEAFVFIVGVTVFVIAVDVGEVELLADVSPRVQFSLGLCPGEIVAVDWQSDVVEKLIIFDHLFVDVPEPC